ncbi:hypothetical protein PBAL39_21265 [Pedobacter sp. BAL39]|nr:hypothetical protein PBAL39_21265 [Pedobacter sp. BAL39]
MKNRFTNNQIVTKDQHQSTTTGFFSPLIQKSKQPQWNFMTKAVLKIVGYDESLLLTLYLSSGFIPAAYFRFTEETFLTTNRFFCETISYQKCII